MFERIVAGGIVLGLILWGASHLAEPDAPSPEPAPRDEPREGARDEEPEPKEETRKKGRTKKGAQSARPREPERSPGLLGILR